VAQNLSDLLQYGSFYLSKDEFEQQVTEALEFYQPVLGRQLLCSFQGKEFWDYHKARLKELGYPLTRIILLKAAVRTILRESVNPDKQSQNCEAPGLRHAQKVIWHRTGTSGCKGCWQKLEKIKDRVGTCNLGHDQELFSGSEAAQTEPR